jgi:hypothetical protein
LAGTISNGDDIRAGTLLRCYTISLVAGTGFGAFRSLDSDRASA